VTHSVSDILKEVSALCAHYPNSDLSPILRQLLAHWTRQLNLHAKGKATRLTPVEIDEIICFIEQKLTEIQNV
jgi:hypothetical protein